MIRHKLRYKSVISDNRKSYRYTLKAARYRQLHIYSVWNRLLRMIWHKIRYKPVTGDWSIKTEQSTKFKFAIIWLWEEYTGEDLSVQEHTLHMDSTRQSSAL